LMKIGLADEHGARVAEVRDRRGVFGGRRRAGAHGRGGAGDRAFQVDQILDGDGRAMQRSAVAALRELTIGLPRLVERLPGEYERERPQLAVPPVDLRETTR